MILASSSSSLAGLLIIAGLIGWALSLWLFVLAVRFLSTGRKAFERYLFMTSDPIRPAQPVPGRKH
jgi:hypothetical protein